MLGLDFVKMSDFCGGDDKLPDIDGLLTYIGEADVNAKSKMLLRDLVNTSHSADLKKPLVLCRG